MTARKQRHQYATSPMPRISPMHSALTGAGGVQSSGESGLTARTQSARAQGGGLGCSVLYSTNNGCYQEFEMSFLYRVILYASMVLLAYSMGLMLSGCVLVPNTITPELEHMSHATQHHPFTEHTTGYGSNIANLVVGYRIGDRLNLEFADGRSLDKHYNYGNSWGEIEGPREEFSARLRYTIQVKP
jgi:hypothetical protein